MGRVNHRRRHSIEKRPLMESVVATLEAWETTRELPAEIRTSFTSVTSAALQADVLRKQELVAEGLTHSQIQRCIKPSARGSSGINDEVKDRLVLSIIERVKAFEDFHRVSIITPAILALKDRLLRKTFNRAAEEAVRATHHVQPQAVPAF